MNIFQYPLLWYDRGHLSICFLFVCLFVCLFIYLFIFFCSFPSGLASHTLPTNPDLKSHLSNEVQVPCINWDYAIPDKIHLFCFYQLCLNYKLSTNSVTMATAPPLRSLWQLLKRLLPEIKLGTFSTQVSRCNHSANLSCQLYIFIFFFLLVTDLATR